MIVGIDLGTTHSLVAVFQDGAPRLLPSSGGHLLTPSVVGVLESGEVVVGRAARELAVVAPERTVAAFKRWMGAARELPLGGRSYGAVELSALVLRALKADAEAALGEPVTEAVVTVPAYFDDDQRLATRRAGELADLSVRRIVNEPTAAALAYGFHEPGAEKRLLVFDLGGGTFDVTLMEVFEGTLEIVATAGESRLGGEDFTERLLGHVAREAGIALEQAELTEPLRVARLRAACERAKRALTAQADVAIPIPGADGQLPSSPQTIHVDRAGFEGLAGQLLERLTRPLQRALRDAELAPEEVDEVILVGGATRMPLIPQLVEVLLGRAPVIRHDPDHVVALGAAVQAALLAEDRAVEDMVMTDVCPHTLGIEITKSFGRQRREGYFMPIIHRNTTLPISREEAVYTLEVNQRHVLVAVYQGESRRVSENLKLGELQVTDIPPGAEKEVLIRFTYDLDGMLEVEALIPETGKRFATVLTREARHLTPTEIEAARARMAQLKFYPRDDLRHRELRDFAERVVGDVGPFQREALEQALDAYESALDAGDRALFEHVRAGLLILLSELGFPYDDGDERGAS